ncbi:MAG TPA: CDP-diacylglycerol--serine O-phosphatidyltransferase [Gammaproteobacteria bacterium]|nr:CDP-diacylglycerol--serine O-phosphatidyltransferase [Gammaproteobacteria bacterium]
MYNEKMVIKRNKNKKIKPLKNGVFILPNIFTTANLFSGCFSIFCSIDGNYELAAIAIFIAVFLDGLDGKVARAANAVSDFGKDYDSLSDLISFGAAPAIFYYAWCSNIPGGDSQHKIIWLISFFYIACAALRLARFNNLLQLKDDNHFTGFPSPAAATLCGVVIWQCQIHYIDPLISYALISFVFSISALMMVSSIHYNSFKNLRRVNKMPFSGALLGPLLLILILLNPPVVLTFLSVAYIVSGPINSLLLLIGKSDSNPQEDN